MQPMSSSTSPTSHTSATTLPTGTVTFLLTDVEGSTRQWEASPEATAAAIDMHYRTLDEVIVAHRGVRPVEQGEGDSVVAAFPRATDAVAAAAAAQRAFANLTWPEGATLRVRMAVHTGEAQLRDAGNYFGPTVIRCARLRTCGSGGQVLLSQTTADLVRDQLGGGVGIADLGRHRLKDLQRPEQVWQLMIDGLSNDFPPLTSLDSFRHNLPVQVTPLVGRERELDELAELLVADRVLTLTGSGGCGKTRLASELAARVVDRFPGGVAWIELGASSDIDNALAAAGIVIVIPDGPTETTLDRIIEQLNRRSDSLVILDNAEHLLDGVAMIVAAIGSRAPQVRVVTTSREPLGVQGEVVWRVPSLAAPADDLSVTGAASVEQYEAVQLFVDRARRARRSFVFNDAIAAAISQICRRLDGVPLAIELAAARVRTMPPERIAAQLDDRFRLLAGGSRTSLPRQQTLHASIAWSEELLDADERTVFARLGVFVGGFTVEAAEALVACFADIDPYGVADIVARLADKSLLQVDEVHDRYSMLETVRTYALQRLLDTGEAAAARSAHAAWCADWLATLAQRHGEAASIHEWLTNRRSLQSNFWSIELERANAIAALDWLPAGSTDSLRIVAGMGHYWVFRSATGESGRLGMPSLIAGDRDDPAWLDAVVAMHGVRSNVFDAEYGRLSEEAAEIARERDAASHLLTLVGLRSIAPLMREGPTVAILQEFADTREQAFIEHNWYVAFNATQMPASSLAAVGRIAEARGLIAGLAFSRARLIESGAAQLAGNFAGAFDHLRESWEDVIEERAPALDESWARLRLESLVLDTGRVEALGEFDQLQRRGEDSHIPNSVSLDNTAEAFRQIRAGNLHRACDLFDGLDRSIFSGLTRRAAFLPALRLAVGDVDAARAEITDLRGRFSGVSAPLVDAALGLASAECTWTNDPDAALSEAHAALKAAEDEGLWPSVIDALEGIGALLVTVGRTREGARLLGAAHTWRNDAGYVYRCAHRQRYVDHAREVIGGDVGDASFSEGAQLSVPEAIDLARRMRGDRLRPATGWTSLTPTERSVVEQVIEGLTNPQIAERLLMGRATVKTHLLHVFAKLGVRTRAELVALSVSRPAQPAVGRP
jgi:predicted ATPase/class 3 adenylate cyclase/DNA-binding CsgD family transcriptional regulator